MVFILPRTTSRRSLVALVAIAGIGAACAERTPTAPETFRTVDGSRRAYECTQADGCPDYTVRPTTDPCATDGSCHAIETTYGDIGDPAYYDSWSCDGPGCKTYPLGPTMTGKAKLVIGHHTDNYECNEAYTYLIGRINAGKVRYFPGHPETMGDTHYDQFMNPTQIHIQKDQFGGRPATPTQTLMITSWR